MPKAIVNGCELYYETAGEGAPVVYIHGGFAGLDTVLRDLAPDDWTWERDFAEQFHFIAYDRRGCYRSSSPDTGYDLANQARDLAGLLDQLAIRSAHIIGSSAGGPIAILFGAQWPERVRSLVLVGTALDLFPLGEPGSDEELAWAIPSAQFLLVDGGPHSLMIRDADARRRAMAFIQGVDDAI